MFRARVPCLKGSGRGFSWEKLLGGQAAQRLSAEA